MTKAVLLEKDDKSSIKIARGWSNISDLYKIPPGNGFSLFLKKMKQMKGTYFEVKTLDKEYVSYDKAETFPLKIDGVPQWEPNTYNEFNYWIPKSRYYVGFGTWIGVTLFYGAQMVEKAVGFEGDPSAYAVVYSNLAGNSHRRWYNHTYIYPVAVREGHNQFQGKSISMRSAAAGNSCSGISEIKTRKDNACGNDMNNESWNINAYTLSHLLKLNEIPTTKETFIKVDVESYECELIPSWYDWMKKMSSKPTLFVSFHGNNVRCCSKEQYDKILDFSELYKGLYYNMKRTKAENYFNTVNCTTEVLVFSDL